MEKYPYLNEAVAHILRQRRAELAMSKKRLSEEAMIARIHITSLESGEQCPSMNVMFYLCDALELEPEEFVRLVKAETKRLERESFAGKGRHA